MIYLDMDLNFGYMLVCVFATYFALVTTLINGGNILSNKLLTKLDIDSDASIKLFTCDCVLVHNICLMVIWTFLHSFIITIKSFLIKIWGEYFHGIIYNTFSTASFIVMCLAWRPFETKEVYFRNPLADSYGYLWFLTIPTGFYIFKVCLQDLGPRMGKEVVCNGLYGYARHPMYWAFLVMIWILPEYSNNNVSFAFLLTAYIYLAVIYLEEPRLLKELGDEYKEYQKNVPALVPRLTAWKKQQKKD